MIEIITQVVIKILVQQGTKWAIDKISKPNISDSTKKLPDVMPCDYYKFKPKPISIVKIARELIWGIENSKEIVRLINNEETLYNHAYPGIVDKLLRATNVTHCTPYEVIYDDLSSVKFKDTSKDGGFKISQELKHVYSPIGEKFKSDNKIMGILDENKELVRVSGLKGQTIIVENVHYSSVASTNLMVDLDINTFCKKKISDNYNDIRTFDKSLTVGKQESYPSFEKSSLANPIGVAGIGITSDNKVILSHRSEKVSTYADKLGPTASGYVEWKDFLSHAYNSKNKNLNGVLATALRREIKEELKIQDSDIGELCSLGFFREFYRAGMPQAFYCFRISLTAEELASKMNTTGDLPEAVGIVSFEITKHTFYRRIAKLVNSKKIGEWSIGLEIQGLLTALARNGEGFLNEVFKK